MCRVVEIELELHVVGIKRLLLMPEMVLVGLLVALQLMGVLLLGDLGIDRLGVEGHLDLGRPRFCDQYVDLLKVLEEGVEIVQLEAAAVVVSAELCVHVKDVECVENGAAVAVDGRRHLGVSELVGAVLVL